jgi:hypothetical protein
MDGRPASARAYCAYDASIEACEYVKHGVPKRRAMSSRGTSSAHSTPLR